MAFYNTFPSIVTNQLVLKNSFNAFLGAAVALRLKDRTSSTFSPAYYDFRLQEGREMLTNHWPTRRIHPVVPCRPSTERF